MNITAINKKQQDESLANGTLVYAEAYSSKLDADQRESKLKHHGSSKHELKKRIQNCLLEIKSGAGRSERLSGDCLPKT